MKIRGGYEPKNDFDEYDVILKEEPIDPISEIDFFFPIMEDTELDDIVENEPYCKRYNKKR